MTRPPRLPTLKAPEGFLERFMGYITIPEDYVDRNLCWTWNGAAQDRTGYPVFNPGKRWYGKSSSAPYRVSYELWRGGIPEGWDVDHMCHNLSNCEGGLKCPHRRCVRPDHLELETRSDNRGRRTRLDHLERAVARGIITPGDPCLFCGAPIVILRGGVWFCGDACEADEARRAA